MKKILLLIVLFYLALQTGNAQPGKPDSSFGTHGSTVTNFDSLKGFTRYVSTAIQSDGKLVATGYTTRTLDDSVSNLVLARFNQDGSPDKSFSGDGVVTIDSFKSSTVVIQNDGKILVAGSALLRFNKNGGIDSSFGTYGKVLRNVYFSCLALQPDGKIITGGTAGIENNSDFIISRYTAAGKPDSSFSTTGTVMTDIFYGDVLKSIVIQNDGKIVAAGISTYKLEKSSQRFFNLVRYNANGSVDNSFNGGADGTQNQNGIGFHMSSLLVKDLFSIALQHNDKIMVAGVSSGSPLAPLVIYQLNSDGSVNKNNTVTSNITVFIPEVGFGLTVQDDGKILVGGTYAVDFSFRFAIARFNSNGTPDQGFGDDGIKITKLSGGIDFVSSLAVSGNKIYAAGSAEYNNAGSVVLVKYDQNGQPDSSYGNNSVAKSNYGTLRGSTRFYCTAIQSNGKIVTAGYTFNGSVTDFAIARYNIDGSLDATFNKNGKQTINFGIYKSASPSSVAIQADGKIVISGTTGDNFDTHERFALARLNSDGSPDAMFGDNGKKVTDLEGHQIAESNSAAIQADGKIVLAGRSSPRWNKYEAGCSALQYKRQP